MASESIKRLQHIDEYEFEEFIADLWEKRDWSTQVTTASRDRGIDIIATRESPFPQKQLIQAKCYSKDNKVGSPEIQRYASLHRQEENVDSVVIVTTGDFTQQAREVANDLNVKVIDGKSLAELILDSGLENLVEKYCSVASESSDSSEHITNTTQESQHSDDIMDLEVPKETPDNVPNHVVQLRSMNLIDEMLERMSLAADYNYNANKFINAPAESNNRDEYIDYRDQVLTKCYQTNNFVRKLRQIPTNDISSDYKQAFLKNIDLWELWASSYLQLVKKIDERITEETGGIRCPECTAQMNGDLDYCNQCESKLLTFTDRINTFTNTTNMEITDRVSYINKKIGDNAKKMTSHLNELDAERDEKLSVVGQDLKEMNSHLDKLDAERDEKISAEKQYWRSIMKMIIPISIIIIITTPLIIEFRLFYIGIGLIPLLIMSMIILTYAEHLRLTS
jgi:hypothetical protein